MPGRSCMRKSTKNSRSFGAIGPLAAHGGMMPLAPGDATMPERSLFLRALEIEDLAQRGEFLARECPDAAARERVDRLLAAHVAAGGILDQPAVQPPPTDLLRPVTECPGTIIGPYKLLQQIGEGGFGVVY